MSNRRDLSRRSFIKVVGGVGASFMLGSFGVASCAPDPVAAAKTAGAFAPNAFMKLDPDGFVTITICKSEMGQGVRTSLALLAAEEMDADWSKVKVTQGGAGPAFGEAAGQGTGGSSTIRSMADHMRKLGATSRLMLIAAAARQWGVDKATCHTENGKVVASDGRSIPYGDLTASAIAAPIPEGKIHLKEKSDFKLIGKGVLRVDAPDIVTGKAKYGIDMRVDGMVYAVIARPPAFKGSVASFDDSAARRVDGVIDVQKYGNGVAVFGKHTWACIKGRDALKVTWNPGDDAAVNTNSIREKLKAQVIDHMPMPDGAKVVSATYDLPYLAHATMEPMNALADCRADSCKVWVGTQNPEGAQHAAIATSGLQASQVTVEVALLGGGFGRRSDGDFIADAVGLSKLIGKPVQCLWTREDDMKHDHYRPMAHHDMKGAVDSSGNPVVWSHQDIQTQGRWGKSSNDFGDAGIVYDIPKSGRRSASVDAGVPLGAWRSVENSILCPAHECFIDELAFAAGKDPFEFRKALIKDDDLLKVLETAAKHGDWGKPMPKGSGRGIACFDGWGTKVAHVIELSVVKDKIIVHRAVAVVDPGMVINPKGVYAMMLGGLSDGLSTALLASITIDKGGAVENSWTDYRWMTMDQMPASVEVHIIESDRPSGGMGEPPYPSVNPCVANAVFAATGKRVRRFPIKIGELV